MSPPVLPPPPPPRPHSPAPPRRRRVRRSTAAGIAIAAAAAAAAATASVTVDTDTATPEPAATVTVSVSASPSPTPSPLPAADADRATCTAYSRGVTVFHAAPDALSVIPAGLTILDPSVRATPARAAAVTAAAGLYKQAGAIITTGIAPGATEILASTAQSAGTALDAIAAAYSTYDPNVAEVYALGKSATAAVAALCERLAP